MYTPSNVIDKKFKTLPFTGEWKEFCGRPELTGTWIVWGGSGNGKTDFCLKLAKYFSGFVKTVYNPLEEGISESFKLALERNKMHEVEPNFGILNKESIEDLSIRLNLHPSIKVIIIDSFQHAQLTYKQYLEFKEKHQDKLIIWVSHAAGKHPDGRTAHKVKYDANVKIYVEGFTAQAQSRYGGGQPFIIWPEGAENFKANQQL